MAVTINIRQYIAAYLLLHGMEIFTVSTQRDKCSLEEVGEASLSASECYKDRKFKVLYLVVNGLLVRSGPQSQPTSVVGKASRLSKSQNLSLIQLKLLTDVIHYNVQKTRLLGSNGGDQTTRNTNDDDIVALGSDILEERNLKKLQDMRKHFPVGERLLNDFEKFAEKTVANLDGQSYISKARNVEFQASTCPVAKSYVFQPSFNGSEKDNRTSSNLDTISISEDSVGKGCSVSVYYFKTLQNILPTTNTVSNRENTTNGTTFINSRIISLRLIGRKNQNLSHPVRVKLRHTKVGPYKATGVFWNFTEGYRGHWSEAGCKIEKQTQYWTIFECNHLTNFAVLVTGKLEPGESSPYQNHVLSIISNIGCFLSMVGEIGTLAVYAATRIRSKRRVILINTVLCLVLGQIIFLAGVEQAKKVPALCKLVAAAICYFFLAAFLWMFNMAVHLHIITSKVFSTHTPFWYFILVAYGLPLLELVLAAGITRGQGFGSSQFCWLTDENGSIWIFLGPVTAIVAINVWITALVLRRMCHTKVVHDSKTKEKIRHVIRAVIMLTPTLGLTWILGVFTMASDDIAMHFVFAVLNSMQGVFIFINSCILDKKVRDDMVALIRHPSRLSTRDSTLNRIWPLKVGKSEEIAKKYGIINQEK